MKSKLFILLLAVAGSACASYYVKPGATNADWQHDHNDCLVKAQQAGYYENQSNDYGGFKRNAFIRQCIEGQGWTKQ